MNDQLGADVPSGTGQPWDSVRRVREPVAWAALVLTAFYVVVSACQLFNLADARAPVPIPGQGGLGPALSAFALRASAVAPQFTDALVIALPVLSVVLVAFSGGLTEHARSVVQVAVMVQAVALVLGVISVAGATGGHYRTGTWFVLEVTELTIVATALIFTGAVLWSREMGSLAPGFEDFGDDDQEDPAHDPD